VTSISVFVATAQAVHRGAQGSSLRLAQGVAQAVHRGAQGSTLLVPQSTAQVITGQIPRGIRVAYSTAQLVRRGETGAVPREAFSAVQVIYTTGAPAAARQRAWTFDLDGHTFYVLDIGERGSLLFDISTKQWTKFETTGYGGHWNFKNGFQWRDGGKVLGGASTGADVFALNPESFLDEGWRPVVYTVMGVLPSTGVDQHRQYALRVLGSTGLTADGEAPVLWMQFSDDHGASWSTPRSVALKQDARQRVEFRSLGAFAAPGRLFRIYDEGGIKYIATVEAEIGGENVRFPA